MEYACDIVGSKLIIILGHSRCGASKGACDGTKIGKLTQLLRKLDISVEEVRKEMPAYSYKSQKFIDAVTQHNIYHSMKEVLVRSDVLKQLYDEKRIGLIAAYHDIETGKVDFLFEDMP